MKITDPHYKILSSYIDTCLDHYFTSGNSWKDLKHHYSHIVAKEVNVKDIDKRFRWDLFWAAKNTSPGMGDFIDVLYAYVDDTHIDTALKKKVKDLETKFSQESS